jgi:periplasmic protein TonB
MKKKLLIATLLCTGQLCYSQTVDQKESVDSTKQETKEIFYKVDKVAEFPGGMGKFYEYLSKNMTYPKDAREQGIEGKVFVEFVIDSTGVIRKDQIKIIQGLYESCDNEAIRLIKECPNWKPAYVTELKRNVPIRIVIPIVFKLAEKKKSKSKN